ncbi:MAG: hypothetical protein WKF94_03705 [Solirubrobacteraceae bacterium]
MKRNPVRYKQNGDKRPSVKDQALDALIEEAWNQEWGCRVGGNKHVMCYPPDGSRMIPIPSTPSDWRTVKNKAAQMKRGGLEI